ncbi:hypothetical protein IWQ62_003301 [Dispira parvispora]|uniref:Uncharacterized protein n=1 Tax=Dispira parvispora TaxID=1520584 RepID=A0A9W8ANY3_9FUNG|nr:hypothetical protein IWQ62_003301 [Dispira parvispora]
MTDSATTTTTAIRDTLRNLATVSGHTGSLVATQEGEVLQGQGDLATFNDVPALVAMVNDARQLLDHNVDSPFGHEVLESITVSHGKAMLHVTAQDKHIYLLKQR